MKTFLIVGVDTVVGANLAASWSEQARVIGLSSGSKFQWPGCTHAILERSSVEGLRQCLQQMRATHVIFCGAAARSTWEPAGPSFANTDAELWAAAVAQEQRHFTMISSDAVYTGPWMFHDENCAAVCASKEAAEIRHLETRVREVCEK